MTVPKQTLKGQEKNQKKTWLETITNDLKTRKLVQKIASNCAEWRDRIYVAESIYLGSQALMIMSYKNIKRLYNSISRSPKG